MNCCPLTWILRAFPFGGFNPRRSYCRHVVDGQPAGAAEASGLRIEPSSRNVTAASATSTTAAPIVQPISSRVLPWNCDAPGPAGAEAEQRVAERPLDADEDHDRDVERDR